MPVVATIERKRLLIVIRRTIGCFPDISTVPWLRLRMINAGQRHSRQPERLGVVEHGSLGAGKRGEHRLERESWWCSVGLTSGCRRGQRKSRCETKQHASNHREFPIASRYETAKVPSQGVSDAAGSASPFSPISKWIAASFLNTLTRSSFAGSAEASL